jgi:hypothetical protein
MQGEWKDRKEKRILLGLFVYLIADVVSAVLFLVWFIH